MIKTIPRNNKWLNFDSKETAEEQHPSTTEKATKKKKGLKDSDNYGGFNGEQRQIVELTEIAATHISGSMHWRYGGLYQAIDET